MIITIDGPASSGKSTVAQALAKKLHIPYLNSGLLFRALGYLLSTQGKYSIGDFSRIHKKDLQEYVNPERLSYKYDQNNTFRIMWDGEDITPLLKDKKVDEYASLVGLNAIARNKIAEIQHVVAKKNKNSLIVEGRDAGSFVFPDAKYKFFLKASLLVRAERWQKSQAKRGHDYSLNLARELLSERDRRDRLRPIAPLIIPQGAIVIDTSDFTIEQVIDEVLKIIKI